MHKTSRFVIISSLLCIMVGIISITFTLSWYAMYPVYRDLNISSLDQSIRIENQVYLRNTNPETGLPGFGYISFDEANQANYIDYNLKIENKKHQPIVNGNLIEASFNVNFNTLNYKLFDLSKLNMKDENNHTIGGFFDPVSGSYDLSYFTFALFQIKFMADALESYAKVNYQISIRLLNSNNQEIQDSYFINNYANNLFKIHIINDVVGLDDDVNPLTNPNYEQDGLRKDMLNDPNNPLDGSYQNENLKELNNSYGINSNPDINPHAEVKIIQLNTEYPLYHSFVSTYDNVGNDENQICIRYNQNNSFEENIYYAHASAIALSFNPKVMMDFLFDNHYSNTNRPIIMPTLTFSFEVSNTAF